jgi:uncharacterized tellurite resistance protein B-like protein
VVVSIMKFIRFMEGGDREGSDRRAAESGAETETVRRIVQALDRLEPERARLMAAFAYLLGRVAGADLKISDDEVQVMERLIVERCGLDPAQAILVAQMAKTQTLLFGGTENYLVARKFGQIATREQSRGLLECLFAVAAADGSISVVEDNEIRRITNELRLTHEEFIQARSEYHDYLAVLRGRPD